MPQLFIFLWSFRIGGVQKHAVIMANHFVKLGWQVHILFKEKNGELLESLDPEVKLVPFQVPNTNNPLQLWSLGRKLKKIIPPNAVVLCNGPNNFRQMGRLNLLTRRWKLIYVLHNKFVFNQGFLTFLKKFEMRLLCNARMSYLVALTNWQYKSHKEQFGIVCKAVIPNFVNFDHEHLSKTNRKNPMGVSLGRYAYQKGYDVLVEAMPYVSSNVDINVYGHGDDNKQNYEARMKELAVNNLFFNGPTLSVFKTNANYDFFISTSRFEGFPLVILEALSCGLPIVSTDFDGAQEVVDDSNGIIVEKENPESIAQGIDQMVSAIKSGRFDSATIRRSAAKYSTDEVMKQYLTLFQK